MLVDLVCTLRFTTATLVAASPVLSQDWERAYLDLSAGTCRTRRDRLLFFESRMPRWYQSVYGRGLGSV
jgi:hypothetical protein